MFGRLKGYFHRQDTISRNYYRSLYCGSCYALGNKLGISGRFLLSYELVAAFSLLNALSHIESPLVKFFCPFSAFEIKKRFDFNTNKASELIDLYLALLDLKLADNLSDERGFTRTISGCGKAAIAGVVCDSCENLKTRGFPIDDARALILHENRNKHLSLDESTESSAILFGMIAREISRICDRQDINDELVTFGSSVGRILAFIDMLDDFNSDMKSGRINPLFSIYSSSTLEPRDILKTAGNDLFYLAREYANDVAVSLADLKPCRDGDILKGIFGRSIERSLVRHFGNIYDGNLHEEVLV